MQVALKHFATPSFWEAYGQLPVKVRQLADRNFELLKTDPRHPSLHLKKVGDFWSARVGLQHRALARECPDGLIWWWIGSHGKYDQMT